MNAERLHRVEAIFEEVLAAPTDQRGRVLESLCASDMEMRELVSRMLVGDSNGMGGFLGRPVVSFGGLEVDEPRLTRVGGYRVIREIGRGGMGVVYEAEQESPRREVALKLIRGGLTGPESLRRFRFEAEVLGQLQHPGIARIFEAGTTDVESDSGHSSSQPFLAMELVRGQSLLAYASERSLSVGERLLLTAEISEAVHHAHQKGVIHRDLKPGNILVDATGPKILDFGVARATNPNLATGSLAMGTLAMGTLETGAGNESGSGQETGAGQLIGTVAYMSPERLESRSGAGDTSGDVYALGVVGYELLTGRLPFDVAGKPISQAIRIVCETDPKPAGLLNPALRGDVEAILGKAMEKAPERRYASAAEFAEDIRRFLRNEPVTARAPGSWYLFRRFARRNRGMVAGVCVAVIALILGTAGTATFAWRESIQAGEAESRAAEAQAVTSFLQRMLGSADPGVTRGTDLTVRHVLDVASEEIASGEFGDSPEVAATLRHTLGKTYNSLGLYAEAKAHLGEALRLREGADRESVALGLTMAEFAKSASGLGELEEAVRIERDALEMLRRLRGGQDLDVAMVMGSLAVTLTELGELEEAEALHRESVSIWRLRPDEDPPSLARALSNFGGMLVSRGKYEEAESILREAVALRRRILQADHPDLTYSLNNLGMLLKERGRVEEAAALLTEVVESQRRTLDRKHPSRGAGVNNLAAALNNLGRTSEAIALLREMAEIQRATLGEGHPDLGKTLTNLAFTLSSDQQWEEAHEVGEEAIAISRRAFGDGHPNVGAGLHNMAAQYLKLGRLEESEPMMRESLAILSASLGEEHPMSAHCRDSLGGILNALDRYDEALPLLERALADRRRALGEDHDKVGLTLKNLAVNGLGRGDFESAIEDGAAAVAILQNNAGLAFELSVAQLALAEARLATGDHGEGVREGIEKSMAIREGVPIEEAWMIADAERVMALWVLRQGESADPAEMLQSAMDRLECDKATNPYQCDRVHGQIDALLNELK